MKPDPENDNLFPLSRGPQLVENLVAQAWKNGGGLTRVIVSGEEWRLSVAEITQDGAFSRFPGISRQIALLTGQGVRLRLSDGTEREVGRVGEILTFSGDLDVEAILVDGPVQVVNLMHPADRPCRMEAVRGGDASSFEVSAARAVVVARGCWVFEGASGQPRTCVAGAYLVLPEGSGGRLESDGDGLLYCVAPG
ncbi:HutD family protein [Gluconobacter cerinus]|uniref:HutD/Ves family protein n=1 Tax=Gluconobacter cerinus TaxID=38307 RepID=UPI001B8AE3C8|nr:HutD family protein [Gluconobacter cerinus]MBS1032133.1 HutD family protein [Gluconobacter cerinus]